MEDNLRLFRAYVPKSYPGRVILFRARARPLLHSLERDLGWGGLVAGGVEIHDLAGNHDDLVSEPALAPLPSGSPRLLERARQMRRDKEVVRCPLRPEKRTLHQPRRHPASRQRRLSSAFALRASG